MVLSISKIKKAGRPRTDATPIMVRVSPSGLSSLDAWITLQREPKLSRPEAIRRLVEMALGSLGDVAPPLTDAVLDKKILDQEAAIAMIPDHAEPSPEAALAAMDEALAKNDLIKMKNKRVRLKNATQK